MPIGYFDPTKPNWSNTKSSDVDAIRENFEWIRRHMLISNTFPSSGSPSTKMRYTWTYNPTSGVYTSMTITNSGISPDPTVNFYYSGALGSQKLVKEIWNIQSKYVVYDHFYSGDNYDYGEVYAY